MDTAETARRKEVERLRSDFPYFAKKCLKIADKDGNLVPFELNPAQQVVWDQVKKMLDAGQPVRILGLKGRQQGFSTLGQGLSMWLAVTREGHRSMTVAHKMRPAGAELFGKCELMYEHLPKAVKWSLTAGRSTGKQLKFENRAYMVVESAEEHEAVGRSGNFRFVHATEIPFWPKADETMAALVNCVPNKAGTIILIESTARGMGDWFHRQWMSAKADVEAGNQPAFWPVFVPWYLTPEYRRPRTSLDAPFTADERRRMKQFRLDEEQVLWYRDQAKSQPDLVQQEYPDTDADAFLSSGLPFFRQEDLKKHMKWAQSQPVQRKGNWKLQTEGGKKWRFMEDDHGPLWIWKPPVKGHNYVVSVDPSSGRARDYSAYHVVDVDDMEVVATYQGKTDPDDLAVESILTARYYNEALWAPERNGVGHATVLKGVKDIGYGHVYHHIKEDSLTKSESNDPGWPTSPRTRPALLERLAELVHSHRIKIPCVRTLEEMQRFIFVDEIGRRAEAAPGCNDDMVMSLAIGCMVKDQAAGGFGFEVVTWGSKISSRGGY